MKVKLLIQYDGTPFAGWQKQGPKSLDLRPTVQATLEAAIGKIFNTPITIQASGRTDAGAHAEAQVAHFKVPLKLDGMPIKDLRVVRFIRSINALTPPEIAIVKAWIAPNEFHALLSAEQKTYRYVIHNSPVPRPLANRYSYWIRNPLSEQKLNALCECLVGEHDFKSFQTSGTDIKSTVRRIFSAKWERVDSETLHFRITGNGFLKQMVRNIVGTTLYLHQNAFEPEEMLRILRLCDRKAAKATAPAHGLFLETVNYPAELDNKCREL